jgi:hypothetical protein
LVAQDQKPEDHHFPPANPSKCAGQARHRLEGETVSDLIPIEAITGRIYSVRGAKVMLDRDLAQLYGVETKQLKRQVRRNSDRFPEDFMFVLTRAEYNALRSQIGTLERGQHAKYLPMAFTEQGIV